MYASVLLLSTALGQLPPPTPVPPVPPQEIQPALPVSVVPTPPPMKPITLAEFATSFKPVPGTYEITFLHPIKKCPVTVCFTLPADCGCPKICVRKHTIEFDYGHHHDVRIHFRLCGKVSVVTH
jgi:hypothetical protein